MTALASICRSIWRFHKVYAGILVLEYALTFAILLSASGVLVSRADAIQQVSGVNEHGLYVLQGKSINQPLHRFQVVDAAARFKALAGDRHVAIGSSAPFLGMYSQTLSLGVPDDPRAVDLQEVNAYQGDAQLPTVLGLRLLEGRWFRSSEVVRHYGDSTHLVILSRDLAMHLFHGGKAIGKQVDLAGQPHTVIGIVNPLAAPQYLGNKRTTYTLLLPKVASARSVILIRYSGAVVRLQSVLAGLSKHDEGNVLWTLTPYASVRAKYFRADRLAVSALAGVVLAVFITALCGILGLTNYWVAKRRPQIAIRRALGARMRDISLHFMAESAVLVITGLLLGTLLKISADGFFMQYRHHDALSMWVFSILLTLLLALLVVYASLRRWQRMSPIELMRFH